MRINKFVALSSQLSRRAADQAISTGRVKRNGQVANLGDEVMPNDTITLDGGTLTPPEELVIIMLNKPVGFVCSRVGQGSKTIFELLPADYQSLQSVGRLDKDSSGLLLLTNDGDVAQQLTHPSYRKAKIYHLVLDKALLSSDETTIQAVGVELEDGISKLSLHPLQPLDRRHWQVTMSEGRNRQIRRTFATLDYTVEQLHRVSFGPYSLGKLARGSWQAVPKLNINDT